MAEPRHAGAIEIRTSFFPLAFLLFLFPSKVSIDDGPDVRHPWGSRLYPLPPGRHRIRVWCPYFGFIKIGDGIRELDVHPGQVTGIEWKCPWLIFLPATWVPLGMRPLEAHELAAGTPATPGAPAGPQPHTAPQPQPVQAQGPAPAAGGPPPGWHPDPHGQAPLRWWDGVTWTEHVSDR